MLAKASRAQKTHFEQWRAMKRTSQDIEDYEASLDKCRTAGQVVHVEGMISDAKQKWRTQTSTMLGTFHENAETLTTLAKDRMATAVTDYITKLTAKRSHNVPAAHDAMPEYVKEVLQRAVGAKATQEAKLLYEVAIHAMHMDPNAPRVTPAA